MAIPALTWRDIAYTFWDMPYLIRSSCLTNYVEVARAAGLAPYALLQQAGIGPQALLDPDLKIATSAVESLLERSAARSGQEDFGLRMGETRQLSNLGPLALVVRKEPTLRRALGALAHYLRLHNEALTLRLEEQGGVALIRGELAGGGAGPQRQSTELVVTVLHRALSLALGPAWQPRGVGFVHPAPRGATEHRRVFGVRVDFGQDYNGIVCAAGALDVPLPTYEPGLDSFVHAYLDARLAQSKAALPERVRQLVLALLSTGDCTAEQVARQLGMDRRTVHRHLRAAGLSLTGVVDAARRELAPGLVQGGARPLSDVATLLGFASQSALARWFRASFGCSVTDWRRRG